MELEKDKIKAAGLQTIAIALGEPKHIERYCGKRAPSLTCYVGQQDDVEAPYYMYGLGEATLQQALSVTVVQANFRAWRKGHFGGVPTGNVKMLPGTFLVDTTGSVTYTYYSQHVADHPTIAAIVQAAGAIT